MNAAERAELTDVADELERFRMMRSARRIRALLAAETPPDERPCPIQDNAGRMRAIPWGLAELLYRVYADAGHGSQSLERLAERGGFGRGELGMLAVGTYSSGRSVVRGYESRMPILDLYELTRRAPTKDGDR